MVETRSGNAEGEHTCAGVPGTNVSVSAAAPLGVYVIVLPVYDVNVPPPLIVIVFLSAESVYAMGVAHVAPGNLKNVSAVGWNVTCVVVEPLYVLPLTHSNPEHRMDFV